MADADGTVPATVNGSPHALDATPDRSLLDVLREDLKLIGTRDGCSGEGQCGSCAGLGDGRRTLACVTKATDVAGKSITTIEGLARPDGTLHPVQQVFLDDNGFQCGYCTSGMIVSVVGHVNASPSIDDATLIGQMNDNLCRCCGYGRIGPAVCKAAAAMRAAEGGAR